MPYNKIRYGEEVRVDTKPEMSQTTTKYQFDATIKAYDGNEVTRVQKQFPFLLASGVILSTIDPIQDMKEASF